MYFKISISKKENPNVKSTLINTLCGKKVAVVGDKPGVTKSQQWTRINQTLELLDTPGKLVKVLEPISTFGANLVTVIHKRDYTNALPDSMKFSESKFCSFELLGRMAP